MKDLLSAGWSAARCTESSNRTKHREVQPSAKQTRLKSEPWGDVQVGHEGLAQRWMECSSLHRVQQPDEAPRSPTFSQANTAQVRAVG